MKLEGRALGAYESTIWAVTGTDMEIDSDAACLVTWFFQNHENTIPMPNSKADIEWLYEFYKIKFKGEWFAALTKKLVLRPAFEFGFLGAYNNDRGIIPFERFFLGGDGLGMYSLDGRETIALRGYPNH